MGPVPGAEPVESSRDAVRALLLREEAPIRAALERSLERLAEEVPPRVLTPVRHALLAGGKRLRPVLCVTAYRTLGGAPSPDLYDLAVSLEVITGQPHAMASTIGMPNVS